MGRKVKAEKIILLYRGLMLDEARQRLSFGFHPFVAWLDIEEGRAYLDSTETDFGDDDDKDEFVAEVQNISRKNGSIAVWVGARGWTAPDDELRPSRHPERQRILLLFESSQLGDRNWTAVVRKQTEDGRIIAGRWDESPMTSGRFMNLLGAGPRLVVARRKKS
jgi:hypothetical protein